MALRQTGIKWSLQTQSRERNIHVVRKYFFGGCNIRYMCTDHSLNEKLNKHHSGLSTLLCIGTSSPSRLPWVPEVFYSCSVWQGASPAAGQHVFSQRHKWQRLNQSLWHQRDVLSAKIIKKTYLFIHIYNQLKLTADPYLLCWLLHCGAKLLFKRVTMNFSQGIKQHQTSNQNSQEDSPLQSDWHTYSHDQAKLTIIAKMLNCPVCTKNCPK